MNALTPELDERIARVRREVADLHAELVRYGLVVWTAGNVSARVPGHDLLVIKPSGQGSALGVRFAASADQVPGALVAGFSYGDRVILERHVNDLRARPFPIREAYRKYLLRPFWRFLAKLQMRADEALPRRCIEPLAAEVRSAGGHFVDVDFLFHVYLHLRRRSSAVSVLSFTLKCFRAADQCFKEVGSSLSE